MTDFRPTRFEILPTVIKNLIVINILVYIAQCVIDGMQDGGQLEPNIGGRFSELFALHTFQSELFRPWQLLSSLFMHASLAHIFFNMYALYMIGSILENVWGPKRFLMFYLVCGVGAALCNLGVVNLQILYAHMAELAGQTSVGASGAIFGCLAAFGYLYPDSLLYIILVNVPIKAKWFVLIYTGVELLFAMVSIKGDNVGHLAHLGGALVGFLLVYFWNRTNRKRFY